MSTKVSIVIPAYNAEGFLADAIESALAQTYTDTELIVVDDGSSDATVAVATRYGDRVRCLRQHNAGQAAARNRGAAETRGDVLAFLDADDIWRQDKLEKQLAVLEREPELGLVYCSAIEIDEHGRTGALRQARHRGHAVRELLLGLPSAMLGSILLVPRRVFESLGGFDVELPPCEDTDLAVRIAAAHRIDYVAEPLVYYRMHAANAHRRLDRTTHAWLRLYRKALQAPEIRHLGALFRARCRGRLYYMLAGDHFRAGRIAAALMYMTRALLCWPPSLARLLDRR